jgi:hypothetical protein
LKEVQNSATAETKQKKKMAGKKFRMKDTLLKITLWQRLRHPSEQQISAMRRGSDARLTRGLDHGRKRLCH